MKTIIGTQNPVRTALGTLARMSALWLTCSLVQADTQTHLWAFNDDTNPAPGTGGIAEITVGDGGVGWQSSLAGLPGATGFWDLGQAGQVRAVLASPVVGPAQITVQFNQWYDGVLFNNLLVSVPNATRTSAVTSTARVTTTGIGYWQTVESVWTVGPGATVTEALVQSPFTGVVDSLSLTVPAAYVPPLELTLRSLGNGSVEISWPVAAGSAQLQSRLVLGSMENWEPVPDVPTVVGERFVVTVTAEESAAYFRLQQ